MEQEKPKIIEGPHLATPEELREILSKQGPISQGEATAQHWRLVEASKRNREKKLREQSNKE
jgi:hypothetical protein